MAIVKSKLLKQLSNNYPNFLQKDLSKFTDIILPTLREERRKTYSPFLPICQKTKKVLEVKVTEQKVRVGFKQTKNDPMDWFKEKKLNQIITVKIISTDNKKGLVVRPEGCEMDFQIKKAAIAINPADARPSRWTGGEKLDCAIADIDISKRKVSLSIKLLEEIEKKEALEKYGSEGSGKNLPFSSLSEDLKKKEEEK